MKGHSGGEDGQTLILVMMITTVLFILSIALGTMTLMVYTNVIRQEEYIKAQCAAEAGIEEVIALIKENAELSDDNKERKIDDGITYSFELPPEEKQDIGNSVSINSMGRCQSDAGELLAQKTLHCTVAVFGAEDYLKGLTILPVQPANFIMQGGITIDGNMVLNGSVDIPDTAQITGSIYASGQVTGDCDGQVYENYDYIPSFPELDKDYYLQKAVEEENGHVFYDSVTFENFDDSLPLPGERTGQSYNIANCSGFYYIDGNVAISGEYQETALIFSTGDINVLGELRSRDIEEENFGINKAGLALISLGNVDINNNHVYANIIAGGSLSVQGGAKLHGAACVGGLMIHENDAVETGLFEIYPVCGPVPIDGAITVNVETKSWKESRRVF